MIWLPLVTTLALAQGPDPLGLNAATGEGTGEMTPDPIAEATALAEATIAAEVQPTTAAQAPAPIAARPAPPKPETPAPSASAAPLVDGGWLFSFGGPLILLLGVGGALWYIRKNGLSLGSMNLQGLRAFTGGAIPEGVQLRVSARTPLAGQDGLAIVHVDGLARPRQLLVTTGPGGSRLIADLSPDPATPAAPAVGTDALAEVLQKALESRWTAPQAVAQAAAPAATPPAVATMAAHAPAPAPAQAQAPAAPAPAPTPVVSTGPAPAPASTAGVAITSAGIAPVLSHREAPATHAFERHLASEVQSAQDEPTQDAAPPRTRPRSQDRISLSAEREPRPAQRGADWRSATYLSRAEEPPPREEDLVDVIGENAADFRERHGRSTPRRRATTGRRRSAGHLAQLARSEVRPDSRRVGGERRRNVLREAGSRQERTDAARALLERVMAQRRGDLR